ncbi:hypothetical protein VTO42DRAFT_8358 [Malbranchea cinnamomea]
MMLSSLPIIEPRDSHILWYTPSQHHRQTSNRSSQAPNSSNTNQHNGARRSAGANRRAIPLSGDSHTALMLEERALRIRKQNIASFGFSWIRPAGFPKTMLGLREEELEREEGAAAMMEGMEYVPEGELVDTVGDGDEGLDTMERDLDGDIPGADEEGSAVAENDEEQDDERGLVEHGEGDFQEEDNEDGFMERDLDDEIPDAFGDEYDDEEEPGGYDLDDDIPSASDNVDFNAYDDTDENEEQEDEPGAPEDGDVGGSMMARNLDSDVPNPAEDGAEQQEWEHTDTDAEDDLDDDGDDDINTSMAMDVDPRHRSLPRHSLRSNFSTFPEPIPHLPPRRRQETEAERLFLERWSGGTSFESSGIMPEPSLRIPRRRTRRYSVESGSTNSIE